MKDTKKILGFCVLISFLSMPLAFFVGNQRFSFQSEFIGQETAEVGELVRFLAEGELVKWECLPHTSDSESYGDHNENFVVSFRKPGTYTVVAAIYNEGKLDIHTQEVKVGGIVVDPIKPIGIDAELVSKVAEWVQKYKVDPVICQQLSANFTKVAVEIQEKKVSSPGQIITRTAELNSDLKLNEGLMAELQAYLTSQADAGNLMTAEQHLVVWNSIAAGLNAN